MGTEFYWLCDCIAVKKVLEYNGSIHQLKRWSQELLAYAFVCIHRPNKMMKDVDGICHHIDPLIHRYLNDATTMLSTDIRLRSFACNFDVFTSCSNPRHVSVADTSFTRTPKSTIPTPSVLYYYPVRFSFELPSSPPALHDSLLQNISVSLDTIAWLSFDSVLHSFRSRL